MKRSKKSEQIEENPCGAASFATVVFLLGGTGGLAYIGLTILILSEVGQNRQKGAKLSWKKVWENFE